MCKTLKKRDTSIILKKLKTILDFFCPADNHLVISLTLEQIL